VVIVSSAISTPELESVLESESEDDPHAIPKIATNDKTKSHRMFLDLQLHVNRACSRPKMVAHQMLG
jgi:hypothetical protein